MNRPDARHQFAARLHELCTEKNLPERGRQTLLARQFGVSQQAVKKWLDGLTYPEMDTIIAIAEWADVNVNWLLQGAGPKRGNRMSTKAQVLEEAIQSLPPEMGADLIDNLRAKLIRIGKLSAQETPARYQTMLDAYEHELGTKRH